MRAPKRRHQPRSGDDLVDDLAAALPAELRSWEYSDPSQSRFLGEDIAKWLETQVPDGGRLAYAVMQKVAGLDVASGFEYMMRHGGRVSYSLEDLYGFLPGHPSSGKAD